MKDINRSPQRPGLLVETWLIPPACHDRIAQNIPNLGFRWKLQVGGMEIHGCLARTHASWQWLVIFPVVVIVLLV